MSQIFFNKSFLVDNFCLTCRYKKLLSSVDLTKDFFYSYTYPIMQCLQKNVLSTGEEGMPYENMFVWNAYLTQAIRSRCKNTIWTIALVHGNFKQVINFSIWFSMPLPVCFLTKNYLLVLMQNFYVKSSSWGFQAFNRTLFLCNINSNCSHISSLQSLSFFIFFMFKHMIFDYNKKILPLDGDSPFSPFKFFKLSYLHEAPSPVHLFFLWMWIHFSEISIFLSWKMIYTAKAAFESAVIRVELVKAIAWDQMIIVSNKSNS